MLPYGFQPAFLSCQSGTFTHPMIHWFTFRHWPKYKSLSRLAPIQNNNILNLILMDSSSHTALHWIMVSPQPDDVITIYSCSPNDTELSNAYCQPSTAEIKHIICNMATPKHRHMGSLSAIR